jgi:hypothetical protein
VARQARGVGRDVLVAGLSMVGSVAVAAVIVLPQVRRGDADRIALLQAQVGRLDRRAGGAAPGGAWMARAADRVEPIRDLGARYRLLRVSTRRVQLRGDEGAFGDVR